jgi:hypothetical protein
MDLHIVIKPRLTNFNAFPKNPNNQPMLPGLMPLRYEFVQLLARLKTAKVEIRPFSVGIRAEWGPMPSEAPLLAIDYIPRNTTHV